MVSTGGALSSGAGRFLVEFSAVEGEAPVSLANLAFLLRFRPRRLERLVVLVGPSLW